MSFEQFLTATGDIRDYLIECGLELNREIEAFYARESNNPSLPRLKHALWEQQQRLNEKLVSFLAETNIPIVSWEFFQQDEKSVIQQPYTYSPAGKKVQSDSGLVWMLDPLGKVSRYLHLHAPMPHFLSISVALLEDGVPVAGVYHMPGQRKTMMTYGTESFAFQNHPDSTKIKSSRPLSLRRFNPSQSILNIVGDKRIIDMPHLATIEYKHIKTVDPAKVVMLLENQADIATRIEEMPCSIAALNAVVNYAGGEILVAPQKPGDYAYSIDYADPYKKILYLAGRPDTLKIAGSRLAEAILPGQQAPTLEAAM